MDFTLTERQSYWRDRVRDFIEQNVRPNHAEFMRQEHEGERWKVIPIVEEMKAKAKAAGIWNLFMPPNAGHVHVDDSVAFDLPLQWTLPDTVFVWHSKTSSKSWRDSWAERRLAL